jgi:hypothetical protein
MMTYFLEESGWISLSKGLIEPLGSGIVTVANSNKLSREAEPLRILYPVSENKVLKDFDTIWNLLQLSRRNRL